MSLLSRSRAALLSAFALVPLALAAPAAHAQANLTFSGGSGTPLTINILSPITYTVTENSPFGFDFNFVGVGNLFNDSFPNTTGTLTYTINGSPRPGVSGVNSGQARGDVNANDVYTFSSFLPRVNPGNTVVLSAGSLTTTSNVTAAAPQSGSYTTFLADASTGTGSRISSNGVSAAVSSPEPGTIALLLTAGVPVVGIIRRRKSAQ